VNEQLITAALEAGALGAKLAGAGDGGTIIVLWLDADTWPLEKVLKEAGTSAIYRLCVGAGAIIESPPQ
jgi:mevalonate kinase